MMYHHMKQHHAAFKVVSMTVKVFKFLYRSLVLGVMLTIISSYYVTIGNEYEKNVGNSSSWFIL